MNTWQYIAVVAIVLIGVAVSYLMGAVQERKRYRTKMLNELLSNVFNPDITIAYCESKELNLTKEQKEAVVNYEILLLNKMMEVAQK